MLFRSYKANDSELDSNLARVNINITPVNDAPVATAMNVITLEDNALVIDMRTAASDVDIPSPIGGGPGWGSFTTAIVTSPAHGVLTQNADGTYTYKVNDAPLGTSTTVTTLEDTPYVFTVSDFGFGDANDDLGTQASRLPADGMSALPTPSATSSSVICPLQEH